MDEGRNDTAAEHCEAAELVARLEILKIMYRDLVKHSVGTNVIESEASRMIRERVAGPMGHRLIVNDMRMKPSEEIESEPERLVLHCWRNQALVRKLTGVRLKLVGKQLKKAKN